MGKADRAHFRELLAVRMYVLVGLINPVDQVMDRSTGVFLGESMVDTLNGSRLKVPSIGDGWLYIRVSVDQLEDVRKRLDRGGIRYWVDSVAVSVNDRPPVVVSLGLNNDATHVQAILDECD